MPPMRSDGQRIYLKRKLLWIDAPFQMSGFLSSFDGFTQNAEPGSHGVHNSITNRPRAAVKLERGSGEETSTGKDAAFHMTQPAVAKRPQPGHAFGLSKSGANHVLDENLPRHFDRGHL